MKTITQYRVTLTREKTLRLAEETCASEREAERVARCYFAEPIPHEELIAIGVNVRNRIVGLVCVSRGGAHGCAVMPADVLRPVLAMGAIAFVLAHNHPSGDPSPSAEDIHFTRQLREASETVGLKLLDHLVIAERGTASVMDRV